MQRLWWCALCAVCAVLAPCALAYTVEMDDTASYRQTCSGVRAGRDTHVDGAFVVLTHTVVFYANATGTLNTVVYEMEDLDQVGESGDYTTPQSRLLMCTSEAVKKKACTADQLGMYLVDRTGPGHTVQQRRFRFGSGSANNTIMTYPVNTTGFYCVSVEPDATEPSLERVAFHGHIEFVSRFHGELPASEHPKLYFYGWLALTYMAMAGGWLWLCHKHRDQILTVQHFITGTIVFLMIEMACEWAFYSYYNAHAIDYLHFRALDGRTSVTSMARFWLVVTNVLEATRDSLSFFLLLIVAMGYGVVRPTLGSVINKVYALTALHFVFGVLYSIGIVLVLLDITSGWVAFFIFPLAFTLTAFYMWILSSLHGTIRYLRERQQTFKCAMFERLGSILLGSVALVTVYFFGMIIFVSFVGPDEFAYHSWKYRWFLLDGVLSLLYLGAFSLIAWTWRPTGHNMRLAMSDELATDENAPGTEFDVHSLEGDAHELESGHMELSQAQSETGVPPAYSEIDTAHSEERRIELKGVPHDIDVDDDDEFDVVFEAGKDGDHDGARRSFDSDAPPYERQRLRLHDDDA